MKTKKLLSSEMAPLTVSSLPTRPTAPTAFGGRGFTSREMKAAFDKLPLLIAERLNSLIDDICNGAVLEAMEVEVDGGITVAELIGDVENGNLATYLRVGEGSLESSIAELRTRLDEVERRLK